MARVTLYTVKGPSIAIAQQFLPTKYEWYTCCMGRWALHSVRVQGEKRDGEDAHENLAVSQPWIELKLKLKLKLELELKLELKLKLELESLSL